uniref:HTH cro/C1-type domain-containing protein n=1 Tax=Rickettsia monacensis TaxID=109232 RepID=A6MYW3_9RICK|nr:helix-turn-helix transcriptional regulator [Rickettsia monacensis]ABQ85887.1 hypothetical protein RM_p19 [Rickettsia monacensis]
MSTKYNTKNFIEQKLLSLKINKKVLAEQINIKYCSLLQIVNNGVTPNLKTLIKIATYFNCSINDVIAVGPNVNSKIYTSYVDISDALQNYNKNLREFLIRKMQEHKLNPYLLARNLGFNKTIVARFMDKDKTDRTLTTPVVIAISQYFNTPIDIIIGRAINCKDNVV